MDECDIYQSILRKHKIHKIDENFIKCIIIHHQRFHPITDCLIKHIEPSKDCESVYFHKGHRIPQYSTRIKVRDLKAMAKERGIKNYSTMNRANLVIALGDQINDTSR